jgi:CHASE1-domain containing sensor protein
VDVTAAQGEQQQLLLLHASWLMLCAIRSWLPAACLLGNLLSTVHMVAYASLLSG